MVAGRTVLVIALPLAAAYFSGSDHPQQHRVTEASDACRTRLGHATGSEFMSCAVDELLAMQEAAKLNGTAYFPVVEHSLEESDLRPRFHQDV